MGAFPGNIFGPIGAIVEGKVEADEGGSWKHGRLAMPSSACETASLLQSAIPGIEELAKE